MDVRFRDPRHDGGFWGPPAVSVSQIACPGRDMVRKRQETIKWSLASKGTGYRPFQQSADARFEVREGPKGLQAEKVERI
jgi:hypothetical protein